MGPASWHQNVLALAPFSSISMTSSHENHWVEIIDDDEQSVVRTLGPYAGFRLAEMAHRGLMRQLNVKRYSAVVVSSREADQLLIPTRPERHVQRHLSVESGA